MTTIVVFGASGDLAKKKTFPALFGLLRQDLLPPQTVIVGYARSPLSQEDFSTKILDKLKTSTSNDVLLAQSFKSRCVYVAGQYDKTADFQRLKKQLEQLESETGLRTEKKRLRLYYMALPPTMFHPVASLIKLVLWDDSVETRIIVEKPFGRDLESSNELSNQMAALFQERELYRIDHYLGKEMVKNILVLKFANIFFSGIWNRNFINNVQITFKEPFGTEGRGGYFNEYGIIRDVIQNHLLQVLAIVAMERPCSLNAEDIRDEKVKVLRSIAPVEPKHVLLGQYVSSEDGKKPGYIDDETVPKHSKTATYAALTLFINHERWEGVPFILKAGKALDEQKAEIRIQFNNVPGCIFGDASRNELVIRVQPNEAVYMKMMNKKPGLGMQTVVSELDLSYSARFSDHAIPDAYEALILDALQGDHANFVRVDELEASWKIFTPLLHLIERDEPDAPPLHKYAYGTRGPAAATAFVEKYGFVRDAQYQWKSPVKL